MTDLEEEKYAIPTPVDLFYEYYTDHLDDLNAFLISWMNENVKTLGDLEDNKAYLDEVFDIIIDFGKTNHNRGLCMEGCTEEQRSRFDAAFDQYKNIRKDIMAEICV